MVELYDMDEFNIFINRPSENQKKSETQFLHDFWKISETQSQLSDQRTS